MNLQRIKRLIKAFLKPPLLALMRFAHRHRFINNSALACLRLTPRLKARLRILELANKTSACSILTMPLSPYEQTLSDMLQVAFKEEQQKRASKCVL